MKHISKIKRLGERFKNNTNGSIVPTFALGLMAILLSAGVAVDYSRISHAKSVMANSMDAALLSAAREFSKGETDEAVLKQEFEDFFISNVVGSAVTVSNFQTLSFSTNLIDGKVTAKVTAELDTAFMAIGGWDKVDIPVAASASFKSEPLEISFMLDVTGSMDWNTQGSSVKRIDALKDAAKNAVNKLMQGNIGDRVKIGLAPYSSVVEVGNLNVVAGGNPSPSGCVVGRSANEYSAEKFLNYPLTPAPAASLAACRTSSRVLPLTVNKANILSRIDGLTTDGGTAGHLGIAWSNYILSDKVGIWTGENKPRPTTAAVRKIAILMTDGEFNTYWQNAGGLDGKSASGQASLAMCQEMRDNSVKIYSVVLGTNTTEPLQTCASKDADGNSLFYKVNTAQELFGVFDAIADDINRLRLSS